VLDVVGGREVVPSMEDGWFTRQQLADLVGISINQLDYRLRLGNWKELFDQRKIGKKVYLRPKGYEVQDVDDSAEDVER